MMTKATKAAANPNISNLRSMCMALRSRRSTSSAAKAIGTRSSCIQCQSVSCCEMPVQSQPCVYPPQSTTANAASTASVREGDPSAAKWLHDDGVSHDRRRRPRCGRFGNPGGHSTLERVLVELNAGRIGRGDDGSGHSDGLSMICGSTPCEPTDRTLVPMAAGELSGIELIVGAMTASPDRRTMAPLA